MAEKSNFAKKLHNDKPSIFLTNSKSKHQKPKQILISNDRNWKQGLEHLNFGFSGFFNKQKLTKEQNQSIYNIENLCINQPCFMVFV